MIQKATSSSQKSPKRSGPGRPAAFDRSDVVERAVELFWRNGYDGTPLDTISAELGISRSTLYGSFGGKDGLWASANEAYLNNLETVMVEPLLSGIDGLADVDAFLDRVSVVVLSEQLPAGCLVINASAVTEDKAFLDRYVDMIKLGLTAALQRAADRGEIDGRSVESLAAMLLTHVVGLNTVAKAGLSPSLIRESIDAMRQSLPSVCSDERAE